MAKLKRRANLSDSSENESSDEPTGFLKRRKTQELSATGSDSESEESNFGDFIVQSDQEEKTPKIKKEEDGSASSETDSRY